MTLGPYGSWRAGHWQRSQANAWLRWRESQESLRRARLQALVTAISQVARGYLVEGTNADATVRQFPDTLRSCDALNFDQAAQTMAYMIWHLADRYGRVTQVLDQLFVHGHLPVKIGGVTILEVGAGPAPALYAVRDYYDDVREWVTATKQDIRVARATTLNSIDRGPAWSGLLHILSETLLSLTRWQEQAPLPFSIQYNEVDDFSIYGEHARILDLQARAIQDEFDRAGEYVSLHTARQFALDDGAYPPSAYDLIVMCNFLTNEEITERFQDEILAITRSLTPGGLLIVLGSAGSQYAPVYEKLSHIVGMSRLRRLDGFDQPLQAHVDEWDRQVIGSQIRGDVAFSSAMAPRAFSEIMENLPRDIVDLAREVSFPQFRVHAWKNEWFRRRSSRGRKNLMRIHKRPQRAR